MPRFIQTRFGLAPYQGSDQTPEQNWGSVFGVPPADTAEQAFANQGTPLGPRDTTLPQMVAPPGQEWFQIAGGSWQLRPAYAAPNNAKENAQNEVSTGSGPRPASNWNSIQPIGLLPVVTPPASASQPAFSLPQSDQQSNTPQIPMPGQLGAMAQQSPLFDFSKIGLLGENWASMFQPS